MDLSRLSLADLCAIQDRFSLDDADPRYAILHIEAANELERRYNDIFESESPEEEEPYVSVKLMDKGIFVMDVSLTPEAKTWLASCINPTYMDQPESRGMPRHYAEDIYCPQSIKDAHGDDAPTEIQSIIRQCERMGAAYFRTISV